MIIKNKNNSMIIKMVKIKIKMNNFLKLFIKNKRIIINEIKDYD